MWHKIFDYFFWFIQPASILAHADKVFGYSSVGLLIVGVIFRVAAAMSTNKIDRKLFLKFWHLAVTLGISGLIWFGLRFENTPIFAERYWFGLIILIGLIWAAFVLKYLTFEYRAEKQEFARELVKNKYLPRAK